MHFYPFLLSKKISYNNEYLKFWNTWEKFVKVVYMSSKNWTMIYCKKPFLIIKERPQPPSLSCGSRPSLTENNDSICTCNATSLGQPTGYLRWSVEDETNQEKLPTDQLAHTSHSRQLLTLSLQSRPLLRCDVIWGQEEIHGELALFDGM